MGVQGLWTILAPCARPIKLETLAHKRLAVDASIWIYQFLKAVRDKEGNAVNNSHVVGFFRRICKLLFFGIRPVFVFDGGAPVLKRRTIAGRKTKRERRRDDAAQTANRLLAIQMKRRLEEQLESKKKEREQRKREEADGWENFDDTGSLHSEPEEEPMPENPVYVEELGMTLQEQKQNRFRKQDPYHLPDLGMSIENMGAPNDHRIMSPEELAAYAAQFREQGDTDSNMSLYDFSKIDFSSPFFLSLPIGDQYAILSAARLRSRLRLGLSKEQLSQMFPNRLDFSRFQIERVRERNELTQRLMTLVGMNTGGDSFEAIYGAGRIAGEKGREYMLVKNDGAEGGWVLGVVGRKEGAVAPPLYHGGKHVDKVAPGGDRSNPIVLDANQKVVTIGDGDGDDDDDDDDDDVFEDVPIEGLNRIPKLSLIPDDKDLRILEAQQLQQAIRNSKKDRAPDHTSTAMELSEYNDSLFIPEYEDEIMNDIDMTGLFSPERSLTDEVEESMQIQEAMEKSVQDGKSEEDEIAMVIKLSKQDYLASPTQIKGKGKAAAFHLSDDESEDEMDLQAAMRSSNPRIIQATTRREACNSPISSNPFGGMLPFEALEISFKGSLLGKKKDNTAAVVLNNELPSPSSREESRFVKEAKGSKEEEEVRKMDEDTLPLPPWFRNTTDIRKDLGEQEKLRDIVEVYDKIPDTNHEDMHQDVISVSSHGEAGDNTIEMTDNHLQAGPVGSLGLPRGLRDASPVNKKPWYSGREQADVHEIGQGIGTTGVEVSANSGTGKSHESVEVSLLVKNRSKGQMQEGSDEELEWDLSGDEANRENSFGQSLDPAITEEVVYSDPEEEDLILQLHAEAEEHSRFAASLTMDNLSLTGNQPKPTPLSTEEYEHELHVLRDQQRKDRRDADEVTQTMISECQELLRLFGLPYITAPMEAEAQCAELVRLCLVDGIVTDDSDCFLFGGTRVYKNMFNQEKFVECYLLGDLEKEFSLDRKKLISLAHLLGSDYTEGLPGIGPVTALELLTEFTIVGMSDEGPVAPLMKFREWWDEVQYLGGITYSDLHDSPFKKKFKKSHATKLSLPSSFPSSEVDEAYLKPEVDQDPSIFQWGVPDLDGLRRFLVSTIGWSQDRCDEILLPVIKDMNRRLTEGTQSNITRFFEGGVGAGAFAPRKREPNRSKRMDRAFQQLHRITSKRTGEADAVDAHNTSGQDRSVGLTPVSMKDAASGNLTPMTAATRRSKKAARSKETDGEPIIVYTSSDSEPRASDENVDHTTATGKKRKVNPAGASRQARKSGRRTARGAKGSRGGRNR